MLREALLFSLAFSYLLLCCDCADKLRPGTIQRQYKARKWTVEINLDGNVVCAGALVRNRFVLTLAKCVREQDLKMYRFIVGADEVRRGENYYLSPVDGDLVLVKMSEKVDVSSDEFKVIPKIDGGLKDVSHRGRTKTVIYTLTGTKEVSEFTLSVWGTAFCALRAEGPFRGRDFCFEARETTQSVCPLLGGHPIMKNFRMKWQLIGLTLPCNDRTTKYAFGVDVGKQNAWINEIVGQSCNDHEQCIDDLNSGEVNACEMCSQCKAYGANYNWYSLTNFRAEVEFLTGCQEAQVPHNGPTDDPGYCVAVCNSYVPERHQPIPFIWSVRGRSYCNCLYGGPCRIKVYEGESKGHLLVRNCAKTPEQVSYVNVTVPPNEIIIIDHFVNED